MTDAVKSVNVKHGLSLQIDGDLGLNMLECGAWSEGTTGWGGCFLSPSIQVTLVCVIHFCQDYTAVASLAAV